MPTFSPDSLLAVRFHNARPGLELVAIIDAALPVALVTADVLAQDRKRIPLLDEFVLRLVNSKVTTETAIAGLLGLPERMVNQTVAAHFSADRLDHSQPGPGQPPGARTLRLTPRGQETAREMAAITPVRVSQAVIFDQLLGKAKPYDRRTVIPRRDAQDTDMLLLPATHSGPVEMSDISAADLNSLLRERGNSDREVLQVKDVTQAPARRVMPAKLLVYADADRTDIQIGVVVDGELSHAHEIALIGHGGAKTLGITVEAPAERPVLEPELEEARVALQEVTQLRAEQAALQLGPASPLPEPSSVESAADEIRAIGVFEHAELLDEALTQARRRILIISPWIKKAIITTDFLSKLESRLTRGVTVHIAYGYEQNDTKTDPVAVRKLENLATRYSDKFTFTRLKSTHAKILIFDDTWITTSFNWLSFKGDPHRTYRMEEGSLVRSRHTADSQYHRYLELIDQQRQ
ncbi:phospholipase D-like domain-containing protein [Streptomyces xanthochromogenes]|uniref:phospholipase D-like domain-containing protein n=1 Tax=Streptomyces xanthochromogenes TaxID=67384 RepID=UPI00379B8CD3